MSIIVHCVRGPNVGRAVTATSYGKAVTLREDFERAGNIVDLRPVDNTRDWNNTADPVVLAEIERERDEAEGRWELEDDPEGD